MKILLWFCLTLCAVVAVQSEVSLEISDDTIADDTREIVNINGTFFYISVIQVNFEDSLRTCNSLRMTLLSVESEEKQELIAEYLDNNGHETQSFWLSGARVQEEHFAWTGTGGFMFYTNWLPGQPDEPEDAVDVCVLLTEGSRQWDDVSCGRLEYFICEEYSK